MSVFFTDSNSEIWYDKIESLGVEYISMPYTLDGVESGYDLGKTHNFEEFFTKIKAGKDAKTAALNPDDYFNIFKPHLEKGEDILYVHFSSALSGTFEFMEIAKKQLKELYPNNTIKTVDTKNISMGSGMVAYQAALLHKAGKSDEEVIKFVEKFRDNIGTYFIVDSLNHLKRGGRISGAVAMIGTVLNLKPILYVDNTGKIVSHSKVNGFKKAMLELVNKITAAGDDVKKYPITIIHANILEEANFIKSKIIEALGDDVEIWIQPIGPTVGTHCGPGTIGVAFYEKK